MQDQIKSVLKKYTKHDYVHLMSKGDSAVFAALYMAKKYYTEKDGNPTRTIVLIQDQGGWLTYKDYAKDLELNSVELKTNDGIIDLNDLRSKVQEKVACIIYTNPTGYCADQPSEDIYDICKNKCLVIMDCSGSIGTDYCNGNHADIIMSSFGRWKPVNVKYGGFISFKNEDILTKGRDVFSLTTYDDDYSEQILKKLENVQERYKLFETHRKKILEDLKDLKIVHPKKWGINVIVKFNSESEKKLIVDYCKENKYEFTLCPRYIRINSNAISIEVKRLE